MKTGIVLSLFIAGLLVLPACAAEITLSSDQKEYYIPLGEAGEIPLTITSSYDHAVDGIIGFTITEQVQGAGTMMTSTQTQAYSYTVPAGTLKSTFNAGSSDVEKNFKVQITFDYTDTSAIRVNLPEIIIHFGSPQHGSVSSQAPVTSTSGAGNRNAASGTSIQIVQQSVSNQLQSVQGRSPQQALSENQLPLDSAALKSQLQREAESSARMKAQFEEILNRDPLVSSVNESLSADRYSRSSLTGNPQSADSGTFSMEYRNAQGDTVEVAGMMENGVVPSIREKSGASLSLPAPLFSNASYQSAIQRLDEQGYTRNDTLLTVSLSGSTVNLTYRNPQGKQAFINATLTGQNLTQLSMEIEREEPVDIIPMIAGVVIAAIMMFAIWFLHRYYRDRAVERSENFREQEPFDYRTTALELLDQAETAFKNQQRRYACSLAGQAIRLFLSSENGIGYEITNTELIAFLQAQRKDPVPVKKILDICSDVEFAKGAINGDEFTSMTASIRSIITGRGTSGK